MVSKAGSRRAAAAGKDAATIARIKVAKAQRASAPEPMQAQRPSSKQANRSMPKSTSTGESVTTERLDRYEMPRKSSSSTREATNARGTVYTRDMPPVIPSLLTESETFDDVELQIMDTDLYQQFAEAFDITLRNNPGLLPGAPGVVDSIKGALLKVQQNKAQKEKEMRTQLEKAKGERDSMEATLRKEMGATAMRKSELKKELQGSAQERDVLQESLMKQREAIEALKRELALKMDDATKEKEELMHHLSYLTKSRKELERALEKEMSGVEKDRNALQDVMKERSRLQRQKKENKELEDKIERMTRAASEEKKALQAEVADLQTFEAHLQSLREKNEATRQTMEAEKAQLKDLADTMQTKKLALAESLREIEAQYKKEIDDLEGRIRDTKMLHEEDMERVVKDRVRSYLNKDNCGIVGGAGNAPSNEGNGRKDSASEKKKKASQSRTEAELQSRMKELELQNRLNELEKAGAKKVGRQSSQYEPADIYELGRMRYDKEAKMERELDDLREEIEIVKAKHSRTDAMLRTPRTPGRQSRSDDSDGIREEIRCLREEMRRGLPTPLAPVTPGQRSRSSHARPSPYLDDFDDDSEDRADNAYPTQRAASRPRHYYEIDEEEGMMPIPPLTTRGRFRSPPPRSRSRSAHRQPRGEYYDDYEEDVVARMHLATPPLRQERPRRQRSRARSSGRSRYY